MTPLDRVFADIPAALATIEKFKAERISLYLLDLGGDVSGEGMFPGDRNIVTTVLRAFADPTC